MISDGANVLPGTEPSRPIPPPATGSVGAAASVGVSSAATGAANNAKVNQGPDDAYLAKVMGSYDPNSRLDRSKADAIRQQWREQNGKLSPNQVYSNKGYVAASSGKPVPVASTPPPGAASQAALKVASFLKGVRQSFNKGHVNK